jgi:hypothetical protein
LPERAVGDALDRRVDDRAEDHAGEERCQDPADEHESRGVALELEDRQDERAGEEAAEREYVAVGEVDELEDPVDERVTERDERVDGARAEADDEDGEEARGVQRQVDDDPDEQQDGEEQPDARDDTRALVEEPREGRGPFSASLDCDGWILIRPGEGFSSSPGRICRGS